MIPVRDGVQLNTVIVAPGTPKEPLPILLAGTLYGAYASAPGGQSALGDHIVVSQDIRGPADSLGNLRVGSAAGTYFQEKIEGPWFAYWLKGQGDGRFPDAQLFNAGTNEWRSFDRWPPPEATACHLHVLANDWLSFDPPAERAGFDEYVSDPAQPVPFQPRPTRRNWGRRMTEDQRFVDGRPDVLTWQTELLKADVVVAGDVAGKLFASTSGTDADWVAKLIDVYPDEVKGRAEMGGYQLMVTGDILRGRYRRSFEKAEPIRANAVEA
jgi:hypothetical protein